MDAIMVAVGNAMVSVGHYLVGVLKAIIPGA